jgi:peptide deformylase
VEALDHHGAPVKIEASGWYARILQHEIDHLDGTLYIDRMRTRTFTLTRMLTQLLT